TTDNRFIAIARGTIVLPSMIVDMISGYVPYPQTRGQIRRYCRKSLYRLCRELSSADSVMLAFLRLKEVVTSSAVICSSSVHDTGWDSFVVIPNGNGSMKKIHYHTQEKG